MMSFSTIPMWFVLLLFLVDTPATKEQQYEPHGDRIVALSGGYSRDEANEKLKKCPGIIASFSRALLADLRAQQTEEEFDGAIKAAIDSIFDASVNKVA